MTKKQIELSAEDISAVEKPANRARLVKAPEHFISQELIADINANGLDESRRGFLRKGFLSAVGGAAAGLAAPMAFAAGEGVAANVFEMIYFFSVICALMTGVTKVIFSGIFSPFL